MFGLGMPEILLILAIALIVIGPQKLPELAKTLGRAMGEFKRSAQELKRSIDMDTTIQDVRSSTTDLKNVMKDTRHKKTGKKDPDTSDTSGDSRKKTDISGTDTPPSSENSTADTASDQDTKNG
jgi:Tat protein translocase TatB subunit